MSKSDIWTSAAAIAAGPQAKQWRHRFSAPSWLGNPCNLLDLDYTVALSVMQGKARSPDHCCQTYRRFIFIMETERDKYLTRG